MKIVLDLEDYACLVRGGELKISYQRDGKNEQINMILSDIGFDRMEMAIADAELNREDNYKEHRKIVK